MQTKMGKVSGYVKTKFSFYEISLGLAFLSFLIALPLVVFKKNNEPQNLSVLGSIPRFTLTNQESLPLNSDSLKGAVLVVNFVFTSCPDTCPLLTAQMKKIQSLLLEKNIQGVRLVSISVDPRTDTPNVLKRYTKKYDLDLKNWDFLTGQTEEVQEIVVGGFKVSMQQYGVSEEETRDYSIMDVTHGEQFVVVDQAGHIRAYRSAKSRTDLDKIVSVIEKLI